MKLKSKESTTLRVVGNFPSKGLAVNPYKILFNKPHLVGPEIQYIQEAIAQGHISGDGLYTKKCEALLEKELAVARVVLNHLVHARAGDGCAAP